MTIPPSRSRAPAFAARFSLVLLAVAARADGGKDAVSLDQVVVLAGQYPTGQQPGSVVSAMDIALTPGANADINRALQLLPGVQQVDEGNALFVRGGASGETITRVNGLSFPSPINLVSPTGTSAGTLNVFEARRIDFSSGGFDARYGNALSGVVDLDTVGPPRGNSVSLGAGLGSVSLGGAAVLGDDGGVRVTATRTDTGPILSLNGSSRDFPDPPHGYNLGVSAGVEYRPDAEIKLFAVNQSTRFSVVDQEPQDQGLYRRSTDDRFWVLSWKDRFAAWTAELSVGGGSVDQELLGPQINVTTTLRHRQAAGRLRYEAGDRLEWSIGFDGARETSGLSRSLPPSGPASPAEVSFTVPDSRWGVYTVIDAALAPQLRAVVSARTDESTLTERTTSDPRLSLAWEPSSHFNVFAAGGAYRQVPDAEDFLGESGRMILPPMQDRQGSAGVQWSRARRIVRLEAYRKDYSDLVALNNAFLPAPFGRGIAQGFDLFLKSPLPGGLSGRLVYSYVDSRRTDPNTGLLAAAPFDVRHSASLIVDRTLAGWTLSAALRGASGRPFTPVLGGTPNGDGTFTPVYGLPFSQRLPPFWRVDLGLTRKWTLGRHVNLVGYLALDNVLNRDNAFTYGYPANYSSRFLIPGIFNRSLYFGASLIYY